MAENQSYFGDVLSFSLFFSPVLSVSEEPNSNPFKPLSCCLFFEDIFTDCPLSGLCICTAPSTIMNFFTFLCLIHHFCDFFYVYFLLSFFDACSYKAMSLNGSSLVKAIGTLPGKANCAHFFWFPNFRASDEKNLVLCFPSSPTLSLSWFHRSW